MSDFFSFEHVDKWIIILGIFCVSLFALSIHCYSTGFDAGVYSATANLTASDGCAEPCKTTLLVDGDQLVLKEDYEIVCPFPCPGCECAEHKPFFHDNGTAGCKPK